jgi:GNAT superfamily N-acetyltransferase
MDWWMWQHKQNPAGRASVVVAEVAGEHEIIGQLCNLPLRMKVNDEVCQAITAVDAMVHPDYRGLGIYSQLRQGLDKHSQRGKPDFGYSWVGQNMFQINQRQGIKTIFKSLPFWMKPINPTNIVVRYFKRSGLLASSVSTISKALVKFTDRSRNYQIHTKVRETKEIDERFDSLWQRSCSLHKIMMVRDRAYLNWRYIKRPDAGYTLYISEHEGQLLGYIVLRSIEDNGLKVGWIVDILTGSTDTAASMDLVNQAIRHFKMLKGDIIMCALPPNTYIALSLRKQGFFMVSKLRRSKEQIICRTFTSKYPESLLLTASNWFLTCGDSDFV